MNQEIKNFMRFQACILADVAFMKKLKNQAHKNVSCHLAVALLKDALG